jgi:uncharacterized protein YndB with AHSA1/START domain
MKQSILHPNPKLDLVLERLVDVPRDLVWAAWTEPEHIKQWFTPAPWKTVDCEVDLRPGGIFRFVMRSPEGQDFPNLGCFLEITPNEKLVWTTALEPGFRPIISKDASDHVPFHFTCVIALEAQGSRTRYTATVIHGDEDARKKHEEMGFHQGWGAALDQLVAFFKNR